MLKKIFKAVAYLTVMFIFGFGIYYFLLNPGSPLSLTKPDAADYPKLSTDALFAATLIDQNSVAQPFKQFQGKILVLNFWATWCPPCREEMPELSALHTDNVRNNVTVVGIAIDEVSLVKQFSQETPVTYPLLAAEEEGMALGNALGNDKGVLPYTVIIDAKGKVVKTFFGRVNQAMLQTTLNPLLPNNAIAHR